MVITAGLSTDYLHYESKALVIGIAIPQKAKRFFKNILGLAGIVFFYIPIYYTIFVPTLHLLFYLIYIKNRNYNKQIKRFKNLGEEKKKEIIKEFSEINGIFASLSKTLRLNKNKIIRTKYLHKSFRKVCNLYIDIEQELSFHIKQDEPFHVPEKTDKELIEMISSNRKLPKEFA